MAIDNERRRPSQTAFGFRLKQLRASAYLTQEELAERAGVSARLVSDLERGAIQRPRRDTVRLLASGLRLTGAERDEFIATAREWAAGATSNHLQQQEASLPLPSTQLVGRSRELEEATSLLLQPETRLMTLTGPGGVGKTRLALEVAMHAHDAFPGAVWFVDLAPLESAALVVPSIARALGVSEIGEQPLGESLVASLQGRHLLVVLDNVEHLMGAVSSLGDLLTACEGLRIMATSRQPLHLRVEREYRVLPLVLPDLERLPSTDELAGIPAVDLFTRRAEVVRRTFTMTTENAHVLAEIAVRLDGLPLAIELAAARIKVLSPADLLARLEHQLPLLTGGAQDLPVRQQTLRATLDWSHDLLDSNEQSLFRRLAVFVGGFSLEAAEAICDLGPQRTPSVFGSRSSCPVPTVLDGVTSLVEKSLVRVLDQDDHVRFGMLETVREYSLEHLFASGEESCIRDRHAAWCLELAERAEPELMGPDQQRWSAQLDAEHDNLRAAHVWSTERRNAETALRLASAVQRFWTTRGLLGEGRRWLEQALLIEVPVAPSVRAKALAVSGVLAYYQGDYGQAIELGEEAFECSRLLEDPARTGAALGVLAMVAEARGELQRAETLFREALNLFQLVDDRGRASGIINNLGLLAWRQGDLERASALHEEALGLRRELGDRVGQAGSLSNLGLVAADIGDYMQAKTLEGESLKLESELGNKRGLADSFENVARIADAMREDDRSAVLFGAAEALRVRLGFPPFPLDGDTNQRRIAELRARLGESAFAAAWEVGREMPLDDAIAYALEPGTKHPTRSPRTEPGNY